MKPPRRRGRSASRHGPAAAALLAALSGCHGHTDVSPPPPAASALRPIDQLAPGELVEGPARAFEVPLPLGVTIQQSFTSVIFARGPVDAMRVANYLRARVQGGNVTVGAAATVFENVTVPANPKRILHIRVDPEGQGHATRLEVRDVTPPQTQPPPTEEGRLEGVGLGPDGKLLDPSHLR